jgi:hypothetical protein
MSSNSDPKDLAILPDEQAAYRQIDEHVHFLLVDISAARADRAIARKVQAAEAALIFCAEILKQAIHEGHRPHDPEPGSTYIKRRL